MDDFLARRFGQGSMEQGYLPFYRGKTPGGWVKMPERTVDITELRFPKPRSPVIIIVLPIVLIVGWGTFAIIPAGHRGAVLLRGSVEKRIMGEGLNFKVPVAERVINQEINCSVRLTRGEASLNVYPYNSSQ